MKIGVLTHPLHGNYGGMIQAYALVKTLNDIGHEAYYLSYTPGGYKKHLKNPIKRMKDAFRTCLLNWQLGLFKVKVPHTMNAANGMAFQKKYVPYLPIEPNPAQSIEKNGIQSIVVGSDQVWRGKYVRSIFSSFPFFFLDFVTEAIRRKSIAYAASFGTDTWDGREDETPVCSRMAKEFKAITVREESGVDICRDTLGVLAKRIADPTLLLTADDYSRHLIAPEKTWEPEAKYLAAYILDENSHIRNSVHRLAAEKGLIVQALKTDSRAKDKRLRLPLSVAQWLKGIRDSEYMITDSFHGCVFSIIFNVPFICLGNKTRGTARFETLLGTYGLENRIITELTESELNRVLNTPIDWDKVNAIHAAETAAGLEFLKTNLNEND